MGGSSDRLDGPMTRRHGFEMPPGPIIHRVRLAARERNGSRMAALLRTLAGSGRNVQGTAAPVHSLSMLRRYAGRAAQSTGGATEFEMPPGPSPQPFAYSSAALRLELEADHGLIADDPRVVTGVDHVRLAVAVISCSVPSSWTTCIVPDCRRPTWWT